MGNELYVVQGTHENYPKQLRGADGNLFTGCLPGDTFSTSLYPGDERAPITPTPIASWIYAPTGKFAIDVPENVTVALDPGKYSLLITVVRTASAGGRSEVAFRGILNVIDAAGTGTLGPTYCTADDLEEFYPEIMRLVRSSDQTGFARARHTVWSKINRQIVEEIDLSPGRAKRRKISGAVVGVGYDVPDVTTDPPSVALIRASLAAGGLFLDTIDAPLMAKIAAGMTLDIILGSKEGPDRARNAYAQSAKEEAADSANDLRRFQPYIDLLAPDIGGSLDDIPDLQIMANRRPVYLNNWGL